LNKKIIITSIGSSKKILIQSKNKKFINLYNIFFIGNKTTTATYIFSHLNYENNFCIYFSPYSRLKEKKIKKKYLLFFFSFFFFFYYKFSFKGKGFKIKKTKKKIFKFYFGHSHFLYFFNFAFIAKKLSKYKHIFFFNKKKKLKKIINFWTIIKPISWYTKRGLRLSKQKIQKRAGKKSTY